jgi:hypothetical protein
MMNFVLQHQFWAAVGIYWTFSAAVSAMPEPNTNGNPAYLWLYRFLHTLAGNVTTVFGSRIPGVTTLVTSLVLFVTTTGCAAHYAIHPGALNTTDSAAYDTLMSAKAAIHQARVGPSPAGRRQGRAQYARPVVQRRARIVAHVPRRDCNKYAVRSVLPATEQESDRPGKFDSRFDY